MTQSVVVGLKRALLTSTVGTVVVTPPRDMHVLYYNSGHVLTRRAAAAAAGTGTAAAALLCTMPRRLRSYLRSGNVCQW